MENNSIYYEGNLYYTVTALSREITSAAENAFLDLGLTPSDALLIMCLNEKTPIQPTEVSEKILLAPSTITRMVEKLEKRSIVSRRQEGKYTFLSPTAKGRDLYDSIRNTWDELHQHFLTQIGEERVTALLDITNEVTPAIL
jgi:MarR family transcriptional regulator, organic hydroperoxide resistance regulator